MIYTQTRIRPRERDKWNSLGFCDIDQLIPTRRPDPVIIKGKKENFSI